MAITLNLQIVRKGTKYESFRVTLPKALIEAYKLRDKNFKLELKGNKFILIPIKKKSK